MQIKTTVRYCDTPVRMAKIQNSDNTKCWQGCGATGTLIHGWWDCKMVQPLWKTVWQFLIKWNIFLPYNPAITFLGICLKELKSYIPRKICTWMFIAVLFIMAQTWKQPRSPSVSEWINKLWCTQTIEYYSGLKRNELSSHERTWRNFKCMLLSERSQSEKTASFQLYNLLEKAKLWRQKKRSVVAIEGVGWKEMNR